MSIFNKNVHALKILKLISFYDLLVDGEVAVAAYKTFRDSAIFTNKRLIVRDAQGLTGKKLRYTHCHIHQSICGLQKIPVSYLM